MNRWLIGGLAGAVVAMAAGVVSADGLKKQDVAAGVRWVAHMDVERFLKSEIGAKLSDVSANPQAKAKIDFLKTCFGVDPLKDLSGITLYGQEYGDKAGVAVIRGTFDVDKLDALIKAGEGHEETAYGNRVIRKWVDKEKGKPGYICFAAKGIAVVGPEVDKVKAAIDVLDGKADNLSKYSNLKGALASKDSFLLVQAVKGTNGIGDRANAAILQNTDWLALSIGELAGQVEAALSLGSDSPENAAKIEQVVRGMVAFMTLGNEQNPKIADLAKGVKVESVRQRHLGEAERSRLHNF